MSLLRDLIYSQQTESDFAAFIDPLVDDENNSGQEVDIQKAANARGKRRVKQINKRKIISEFHDDAEEDYSVSSTEDDRTDMRYLRTSQQRNAFGNRLKSLQIYCNSPEIRFQTLPEVTRYYVPGFSGFLKFPQHKRSIIDTNKDIVRNVWYSCYHAKDYEGACQALETLTKIQKLTTSELVMFTEMLRSSLLSEDDESPSGGGGGGGLIEVYQCLLQQCVPRKVHKGNDNKRVELVQVFVELFLSPSVFEAFHTNETNRRNVDAARNMLKAFLTEARIAKHPRIVCMNIIVHVLYVSVEASVCMSSLGDKDSVTLPSWKEISLCPMYFMQVVRVLHCIASSTSDVICWEDRRDQCIRLLKELDAAFRLCAVDSLIDIIELRVSYYLGIGNLSKAEKSLKQFRNYILRSERSNSFSDVTVAMNRAVYYRALARFFIISKRESTDSWDDVSGFVQGVSLWLQNEQQLSSKKMNISVLLFQTGFLSKEALLEMVCNGIERSPEAIPLPITMGGEHTELHCTQWMLWMVLANLLGQIHNDRRIDLTSPIHSSSDLYCLFSLRNDRAEADSHTQSDDEADFIRNSFYQERKWWYGRILSTSNLDDFVDSILSSDVDMLVEELQQLDPWDCLRTFDVLSDSKVCYRMWDSCYSDHHSDDGGCSLFEHEDKFEYIFGPGWRLDFQRDYEGDEEDNDDGNSGGDDDDDEPFDRAEEDGEEGDNGSDLSCPPASDYQQRIPIEEDAVYGVTDATSRLVNKAISNLCHLAREELFQSCPRVDQAAHFCCLRSRFTNERNQHDVGADQFTTELEIGDFLPTKQWQQQHLHETGQKEAGLVDEELAFHRLSDRLLEMLAVKIVVCCHIQSQDCLFVVRAVQVLIQHCLPFYHDAKTETMWSPVTAKKCILYLQCMGVNILRAADLAKHLALKEVPVCYQSAPVRAFSTDNIHHSNSFGQYRPI